MNNVTMETISILTGKYIATFINYTYRCTSYCTTETGFTCVTTATPNTCTEICGDGKNMGFKACDDGNAANGDG